MAQNLASCPYSGDYDFHQEKYYCSLKECYVDMGRYQSCCYRSNDYMNCPAWKHEKDINPYGVSGR